MINIVFEGSTGSGKTTIIKELREILIKENYKVGITNDIDPSSPLYNVLKNMFEKNVLVSLKEKFNTLRYETLVQSADYLYLREKTYSENNDINLFDRNYLSIYSYQSVLLKNQILDYKEFMKNIFNILNSGEKGIDLLVYFKKNINKDFKRSEKRDNRKYTIEEKKMLKMFDMELNENVRIYNDRYKLLIIEEKDNKEETIKKIYSKIKEIVKDKYKNEEDKWYELYKIDVEGCKNPDEYIELKLKYKKRFIKEIMNFSQNRKVLEAGCGTALMAGYLSKKGLNVEAIDISEKMLKYAKNIALKSNVISPCIYKKMSIFNLNYKNKAFDVSYSNGVLEHFNNDDIIRIIKEQLKVSKYVMIGVPSTYFDMKEKMYGNERSLTSKEWEFLIRTAGGKLVKKVSFDYYPFYKRIFEIRKWFKPRAFWLFIIE